MRVYSENDQNLMSRGVEYFHPALFSHPKPARSFAQFDLGFRLVRQRSQGTTLRDAVSLSELLKAWYASELPERKERSADEGAMRYMVESFGLDLVLFMIDAARAHRDQEDQAPLRSPLDLKEFYQKARELLTDRLSGLTPEEDSDGPLD